MALSYKKLIAHFSKGASNKLLSKSEHALERESLRVNEEGDLATSPHPESAPLTHPYITTD